MIERWRSWRDDEGDVEEGDQFVLNRALGLAKKYLLLQPCFPEGGHRISLEKSTGGGLNSLSRVSRPYVVYYGSAFGRSP